MLLYNSGLLATRLTDNILLVFLLFASHSTNLQSLGKTRSRVELQTSQHRSGRTYHQAITSWSPKKGHVTSKWSRFWNQALIIPYATFRQTSWLFVVPLRRLPDAQWAISWPTFVHCCSWFSPKHMAIVKASLNSCIVTILEISRNR